ncbi:MAG: alpha/beta fold hydrolase [Acidimicrobiia bacterium]
MVIPSLPLDPKGEGVVNRLIETGRGLLAVEVTGNGPDLLLLHSLLTDRTAFDPIVPALSEKWRVNKVALPGFGASTRVDPTMDAYADSIGALLVEGDYDPASTAILGNGFGGFVALGTAVRHGDRFDRLVLLGCGTGFEPEAARAFDIMSEKVAAGGMSAVVDLAIRRIFTEDYLIAHPAEEATRRQVLLRTDPESFQSACRALRSVDYSGRVAGVHNPTLVVVGSEDQATPPAMGEKLAARLSAATFSLLPGLAHAPHLQDPRALLEALAGFLGAGGFDREKGS